MLSIYNACNPPFVNTSEAYSKTTFFGKNTVVIPYINIGLMPDNPINNKQSTVDYSYYVLTGVESIFANGSKEAITLNFDAPNGAPITEYIGIGGYETNGGAELTIKCEGLLFYLPATSQIDFSGQAFIPIDTPYSNRNMEVDKSFFELEQLPAELKTLLGGDIQLLTLY
ncbi:MAG TPA: hypothetical protein VI233_06905 [Puia sp.]